jgi:hypothetical protein
MSVSVVLPSRPRAVRIVGCEPLVLKSGDAATAQPCVTRPSHSSTQRSADALDRLVRAEPAPALRVLEDWLQGGGTHVSA